MGSERLLLLNFVSSSYLLPILNIFQTHVYHTETMCRVVVSDTFGQGCERLKVTLTEFCVHFISQGSHRLEKYLILKCFLEKSLKINSALKSTGTSLKSLE